MRHGMRSADRAARAAATYRCKSDQMSKIDILYAVLFVGLFPALWGFAALLDHVWPSNYERQYRNEKR
jgi:hypothetical protein